MTFLRLVVLVLSLISAAPNPEAKCGSDPGCFSGQGDACFSDHHIHGNYIRPPRCLVGNKAEDYKQGCQALDCAPNRTCHWTNDTITFKSGIQNGN